MTEQESDCEACEVGSLKTEERGTSHMQGVRESPASVSGRAAADSHLGPKENVLRV